ncbi:MAG: GNAT family N-acetyltransferase [Melioribacteraceae bacterium]|nr:GNAT family N-acetyltransferase [Melioribacteraceae bacterium]MCF8354015.1 GNAT family N-acetyltransferase [Melioribacteraceae bacterium]MCF8392304.1 GNAT family N-acetyltransferase [Melioribacteraceae bacterium]MCF8417636.1 GNAT family N-acetyltransferase [Melioribacteraceae bacterium]
MSTNKNTYQIANISVVAKVDYLPVVTGFVRDAARKIGLQESDANRLELVVEEACLNVIEHAFEPGEQGYYTVTLDRKPTRLDIAVEDMGLPFDFTKMEDAGEAGLGAILMRAFADEVKFTNLGRKGKRVELVKYLPFKDVEEYISEDEIDKFKNAPPADPDEELYFDLMIPDQAVDLARCVYRSYGYSYPNDSIYFPDKRKELIESGLLESCVVTNSKDEIVGHLAMVLASPDSMVAEAGQAVVDPRYRGKGLFKKMKKFLIDHARDIGMYGLYSESVSIHPFTQRGNLSLGANETGLLFAFAPLEMNFKKIEHKIQNRQTTVLFYQKINESPSLDVYPPFHHKTIIGKIYGQSELKRNISNAYKKLQEKDLDEKTKLDVKVIPDAKIGFMSVIDYGRDFEEHIHYRLKELCLRKVDSIYIDLPLAKPHTQQFCAVLEMYGFFFAGVIPELFETGDVLRLQYLNNVEVDTSEIVLASEFGQELLEYIVQQMNK